MNIILKVARQKFAGNIFWEPFCLLTDYCDVSAPPNLTQRARLYDGESHS